MFGRRSFLQFLGLAPAAVAMGVGPSSTAPIISASTIALGSLPAESIIGMSNDAITNLIKEKTKRSLLRTMRPAWWKEEIEDRARQNAMAQMFDHNTTPQYPNIMALKSASAVGKIWMIQNAAAREELEDEPALYKRRLQRVLWMKANGHD